LEFGDNFDHKINEDALPKSLKKIVVSKKYKYIKDIKIIVKKNNFKFTKKNT
jgi:hypothetical protein